MSKRKHADVLVCLDADALTTLRGSTFDRSCGTCERRVMISPTGQRFLKRRPGIRILCERCYAALPDIEVAAAKHRLAAPPSEILAELKTRVPNLRRQRN
jgi:hypothetical protein